MCSTWKERFPFLSHKTHGLQRQAGASCQESLVGESDFWPPNVGGLDALDLDVKPLMKGDGTPQFHLQTRLQNAVS